MTDIIGSGNKKDKWTKRVTDLLNWLNEKKQAKLVAGDNVTLTPQQDGTVEISAGGGAVALDDLTDVDVSSVTDGQALVYDETNQEWVAGEAGQVDDVKVNGTSVVSNKIAEITSYKEVTQAEYDALPSSKNSDGILYCIKDSGIDAHDRFCPIIYSYNEREVGVWLDGKPLYQKTVHIDSLNDLEHAYDYNNYPHGIANIDNIANYEGRFFWKQHENHLVQVNDRVALFQKDNGTHDFTNIFRITNGNFGSSLSVGVNREFIQVACGTDRTALSLDCTIWYTKTTDVAGSGNWGSDGIPMEHYSTSERIVGTWIDGKTLFERVLSYTLTQNTGSMEAFYPYPNDMPNVDTAFVYHGIGLVNVPRPYSTTAYSIGVFCGESNGVKGVKVETGINRSSYTITFVVRYTKTT